MDIRNNLTALFSKGNSRTKQTPYGTLDLARKEDRQNLRKLYIDLQRTTDALTRKDIADWRSAWQLAISVDSPNRSRLYDIYNDVEVDLHLAGCVEQRTGFVMAKSFRLIDADGNDHPEAAHYFDQEWFRQLCHHILQSIYWGHSLIELGDIMTDGDGCICYDGVTLIPRKHVIPEYGRVIPSLGQDWRTGIDYRQEPYSGYLIEAGDPHNLGLYLKAATQTIPKKNVLSFWDTFSEIFGMPMRIVKTGSRDEKEINRLNNMLGRETGANASIILPFDTEIQFLENAKGDAYNVYDRRIDRANSELSKGIIGQTMTIEDGSSLSQSETHLEVFQNLVRADSTMLRGIINNQLLPRMIRHGFPLVGLRFEWDETVAYTPEQQAAIETAVLSRYDIDPKYFEQKYGIPCKARENTPSDFFD